MDALEQFKIQIYTSKAQADKAINSLKGILLGINSDGQINAKEIEELDRWVIEHNHLINRNPFNEFLSLIQNRISNKIPSSEAIEDLFWLCQKYEGDNYYYSGVTSDLQILQGICHGILADGEINDHEIFDLHNWLQTNEHLNTYYPYDEIRSLILSVVADKVIDDQERTVLKAYFNQFVNLHNPEIKSQISSETAGVNIAGLCTSDPQVTFPGKTFCITGILQRGNREDIQKAIELRGGIPTESVTKKTDYLIVGDNGNPAWAFSCYGRKVEKALSMRKEGHTIVLIHEFDFADILEESEIG